MNFLNGFAEFWTGSDEIDGSNGIDGSEEIDWWVWRNWLMGLAKVIDGSGEIDCWLAKLIDGSDEF